ncbi:hypothetical protein CCP2SC5_210020 [Azospirillaceae bacterium]
MFFILGYRIWYNWVDELTELHNRVGDCFLRKEPRDRALEYLKSLRGSSRA